jgi:hypothetical protein
VGVVFENRVTPLGVPREVNVSGKYVRTFLHYNAQSPAWNSTIFFACKTAGLGMVALDDYYRLQVSFLQEGKTGVFRNESFGLPPGESYTFVWALYPTPSGDYYDFINAVRADWVPSYTLEGSCAFLEYPETANWPREKLANWLRDRAAKIVIISGPYDGGPWLCRSMDHYYKIPPYTTEEYLANLKKARQVLKEIDPEIKCLAPFETAMSPDAAPGDDKPAWPDAVSITARGKPGMYEETEGQDPAARQKLIATQAHRFLYYPVIGNSYHRHVKELVLRALNEAEMDGIYFDCFSYGYGGYGFRWTYDRWDNRSVDMAPATYTILRTKADLCKLTEDARADLVRTILDHKKGNAVVVNDMAVTRKIMELPIFHFTEVIADYGYVTSHMSTPIILGWSPGYAAGAKEIGKEGAWWKEWKTDKDYFEDIKDKLRSGCLYYTYWAPGGVWETALTHPSILSRMFPITVESIHAGWIQGKERIITLKPGRYTWNDPSSARAFFYDGDGKECEGRLKVVIQGALRFFEVEFPEGGAAVIEKVAPLGSSAP